MFFGQQSCEVTSFGLQVLSQISGRVEEEKQKVDAVGVRLDSCRGRLHGLAQERYNKATVVTYAFLIRRLRLPCLPLALDEASNRDSCVTGRPAAILPRRSCRSMRSSSGAATSAPQSRLAPTRSEPKSRS